MFAKIDSHSLMLVATLEQIQTVAQEFSIRCAEITAASPNESSLRHEIETELEKKCAELSIPWTPYTLDLSLKGNQKKTTTFADAVHGAIVIEYEPPQCFKGAQGQKLRHAQDQAEGYTLKLSEQEGRPIGEYEMLAWDGSHVSFGKMETTGATWLPLRAFDAHAALIFFQLLVNNGRPLVNPQVLAATVGPESQLGRQIIPLFFQATRNAAAQPTTSKTKLLFTEWKRLFGQVIGVQSDQLRELLQRQGAAHRQPYDDDHAAYLFALNTHVALVAKLVAALALPQVNQDLGNSAASIRQRFETLESGQLFADAGVANMLNGDFFSWYLDAVHFAQFEPSLELIVDLLSGIDFDVSRKNPDSTRDLFKGLYQSFVPSALRHALGEYYTSDWLAQHTLEKSGWQSQNSLLDPTCGSGTFLLQALKKRLDEIGDRPLYPSGSELLVGLHGLDLNPLAVLCARASIVVSLARFLNPDQPLHLPVYLADAINVASLDSEVLEHTLPTEKGDFVFRLPQTVAEKSDLFAFFGRLRELVELETEPSKAIANLQKLQLMPALQPQEAAVLSDTIERLNQLHNEQWNGIWCSILAERFAAATIAQVEFVVGNPPWVKWSHLPRDYAQFIQPICRRLGVFSQDTWVGGIEADISTVITYEATRRYLSTGGTLAFLITGTVFRNESSAGFRAFHLADSDEPLQIVGVEDFKAIRPFEDATNHTTLLIFKKGEPTNYPVPYRVWNFPAEAKKTRSRREFANADAFQNAALALDLQAQPVPGTHNGPWIIGTAEQQVVWAKLFSDQKPHYKARKGVTTDANGIFFVRVLDVQGTTATVRNDPTLGRRALPEITGRVETEHLFPLLRGKGVMPFTARPDENYHFLMPQRGMHGDPELALDFPRTFQFLKNFESELQLRSSFRRYQPKQAWYSLWSTGAYTFAPHKVVWREMPGNHFAAAVCESANDSIIGERIIIPDHKVYFVALESREEAHFLCAILNAPVVSEAISAFTAALSSGVSVVEYLDIPLFDATNPLHQELMSCSIEMSARADVITANDWENLNQRVVALFK